MCGRLSNVLWDAVTASGLAHVVAPGVIRVLPGLGLEPDVLVYPASFGIGTHWDKITGHWLAVEVLSPSSRVYDRDVKCEAYLALGVAGVWLVDAQAKMVEVFGAGFSEPRKRTETGEPWRRAR